MPDLKSPGVSKAVAKRVLEDIDRYCVETYDDGHRWHLGASLIGHACSRYLWYLFRWTFREKTDGRKQRLFNRGHREEARFIEWLEGIGAQVWYENYEGFCYHAESDSYIVYKANEERDPLCEPIFQTDKNFKQHVIIAKAQGCEFPQYRVSACNGHFGGSLDGIVKLPAHYEIEMPVLAEFKTNGTGKGFNDLGASGMPVAKPMHFCQTSTYGSDPAYGFEYCLYFNINKNDDSLHVEVVKLDHKLGQQMREKAERIIFSQEPPAKLSENATYVDCTYCAAKEICHKNGMVEKNCRSCINASPIENGEWHCALHNGTIPRDFVPKGCDLHYPITSKTFEK